MEALSSVISWIKSKQNIINLIIIDVGDDSQIFYVRTCGTSVHHEALPPNIHYEYRCLFMRVADHEFIFRGTGAGLVGRVKLLNYFANSLVKIFTFDVKLPKIWQIQLC